MVLPVEYSLVEERITRELLGRQSGLVLGLGVAPGRNRITPEKIAINLKQASEPDNSGKVLQGVRIDESQPDGLFTNLPVEDLVKELNAQGIPSAVSLSAGAYLCNNAMFVIAREARRRGFGGGFIHIPCHSEFVARLDKDRSDLPSIPIDTMRKAIEGAIGFLSEKF